MPRETRMLGYVLIYLAALAVAGVTFAWRIAS